VNFQYNGPAENHMLLRELPLHNVESLCVMCCNSKHDYWTLFFPPENINSHQYVTDSVCHLVSCWIKGEPMPLSQEDSATATQLSVL